MILHITCNSCANLRTLDYQELKSPAGNRCCFCGDNVKSSVRGFEFHGSEITCQSDHKSFNGGREGGLNEDYEVIEVSAQE